MTLTYRCTIEVPPVRHDQIDPPCPRLKRFGNEDGEDRFEFETDGDDAQDIAEFLTEKPSPEYVGAIRDALDRGCMDASLVLRIPDFEEFMKDRYFDKALKECEGGRPSGD